MTGTNYGGWPSQHNFATNYVLVLMLIMWPGLLAYIVIYWGFMIVRALIAIKHGR